MILLSTRDIWTSSASGYQNAEGYSNTSLILCIGMISNRLLITRAPPHLVAMARTTNTFLNGAGKLEEKTIDLFNILCVIILMGNQEK